MDAELLLPNGEASRATVNKRKPRKRDMITEKDEDSIQETGTSKRRKPHGNDDNMKKKHNITSQKGRAKINVEIATLKELLPECREMVQLCKASILHCAASTVRKLNAAVDSASEQKAKLSAEINRLTSFSKQLVDELNVYRAEKGLPPVQNLASRDLNPSSPAPTHMIVSPKSEPESDETSSVITSPALDELLSLESTDSVEDLSPTEHSPLADHVANYLAAPAAYIGHDYTMGHKVLNMYETYDPLVIPTQFGGFDQSQHYLMPQHPTMVQQQTVLSSNNPSIYNFGLFAVLFFVLPYTFGIGDSFTTAASSSAASRALLSVAAESSPLSGPWVGLAVMACVLLGMWAVAALAWSFAPKQIAIVPTPESLKKQSLLSKILGFNNTPSPSSLSLKAVAAVKL